MCEDSGKRAEITLSEVLFVPDYGMNLISIVTRDGTVFPLMQENNLFRWSAKFIDYETQEKDFCNEQCLASSNLKLWHDRLGHNIFQDLINFQNHVDGMQIDKSDSSELKCDTCVLNKAKRKAVPKDSVDRANNVLDIVHVDILGSLSVDNHRYATSFVCSFSRYSKVYFMKFRDECLQYFQQFCADLGTPQTLVGDGAKEFSSTQFSRFCRENKVRLENSAPYTPEENGKVERKWGTTTGMTRCLLENAGLGKEYWTYAMNYAFYSFHASV